MSAQQDLVALRVDYLHRAQLYREIAARARRDGFPELEAEYNALEAMAMHAVMDCERKTPT